MDVKLASPFVESVFHILGQIGLANVQRGKLGLRENLRTSMNVSAVIGLSNMVRGNVVYTMSQDTANKLASLMMGMPVEQFDEIAQSAIAELANMIVSNTVTLFEKQKIVVEVSPPTLVVGENIMASISQVQTLVVEVITEAGLIEVNIGLET